MPPPRRRRPSSIDRLDQEVRDLIRQLRIDAGWTIDEILNRLRELGQSDISRSALGRHVFSIEETGETIRLARETALALVPATGDGQEDRVADLNIELCQALILKLLMAQRTGEDGEPVMVSAGEINLITKSMQQAASAKKTNIDNVMRIRREATEAAAKRATEAAVTTARAQGMSVDGIAALRTAISTSVLGVGA